MSAEDQKHIPANAIFHSCGSWWTGATRSHCAAPGCHLTFSGETAAEKHRVGKHGVDRRCVDPASVGLVPREKPYGILWAFPTPEDGGWWAKA